MESIVQLIILSANHNGDACVVVKDGKLPSSKITGKYQPLDLVYDMLFDLCGVHCLKEEFLLADEVYVSDNKLFVTYCVIIPHNINNSDNKYKTQILKDYMYVDGNQYNTNILNRMLYKV